MHICIKQFCQGKMARSASFACVLVTISDSASHVDRGVVLVRAMFVCPVLQCIWRTSSNQAMQHFEPNKRLVTSFIFVITLFILLVCRPVSPTMKHPRINVVLLFAPNVDGMRPAHAGHLKLAPEMHRRGDPLQGAQPMPSHCPPNGKCQFPWHL